MSFPYPASPPDALCEELLLEAERAAERDEIPVAAGLYRYDGSWQTIAVATNATITENDPLAHAEILIINEARRQLQREYLNGFAIVSTLEPCLYCTGALLLTRIDAIYYFARSDKGIRLCDVMDMSLMHKAAGRRAGASNHHPEILPVEAYAARSARLLEQFFRGKRTSR